MCGIVGIWLKNESDIVRKEHLSASIASIQHRGPDASEIKIDANVGLGHARLSIIDLSSQANQPMSDPTGRYTLVFNGEIYNYKELIKNLPDEIQWQTNSDTEVLLHYLIHFGLSGIKDLNGFFSFLFYDHQEKKVLFARDRYGIKPLFLYEDHNQYIFSSELSALFSFEIDKTINREAIDLLFQLTYIPAPYSILNCATQILPGHCGYLSNGKIEIHPFYDLRSVDPIDIDYDVALSEIKHKVTTAVRRRLLSDVPLGTFLSGGVDSSIISLVAKQLKKDLKTFSVGFDVPYFDESVYATEMAESIGSDHHQIQLTKADFKEKFKDFLSLNHQPFADSSAFAVYLLSQKTKDHVTVCLSGDGADELFGGYRKHEAEFRIRNMTARKAGLIKWVSKLTRKFPEGRHSHWKELNRKIQKLARGLDLTTDERYWQWLTFIDSDEKNKLLKVDRQTRRQKMGITNDLNSVFMADQQFVLPNDMLTKVDRMSMACGLEVRTPFLDHELVDYVNSLPSHFKVSTKGRKQLLIDAFKSELPERIYNREKKGFEIPIFDWLRQELSLSFNAEIFSESYIQTQDIFNYDYICQLKNNLESGHFGDKVHLIWTLIVFQNWWHRNIWK